MNKKKGISLIVLVITIIIVIILATAVILNLANNNPIETASKAKVLQDYDTFKSDLVLTISRRYLDGSINDITDLDSTDESPNRMTDLIPSMEGQKYGDVEYKDIFKVVDGNLVLVTEEDIENNPNIPSSKKDRVKDVVKDIIEKIDNEIPESTEPPVLDEEGIAIPNMPQIKVAQTGSSYTKGPVSVTISTNVVNEKYKLCYRIGTSGEYTLLNENRTTLSMTGNGIIYAKIVKVDTSTNTTEDVDARETSKDITIIDNQSPTEATIAFSNVYKDVFVLNATGKDAALTSTSIKSGIEKYEFYVNGSLYKTVAVENGEEEATCMVENRSLSTSYECYVIVKDKAGNEKTSTTTTVTTTSSGYMVMYNAPGATNVPDIQTKSDGTPLTLSDKKPRKSGYIFKNWLGSDGNTYEASGTYTADKSVVLTAQFEVNTSGITEYTLTVNHYLENANNNSYTLVDTTTATVNDFDPVVLASYAQTVTKGTYAYGSLTSGTSGGDAIIQTQVEDDTTVGLYYSRDRYTLTLTKGSYIVSVSPNAATKYKVDQTVSISATPSTSTAQYTYSFSSWSGTYASSLANASSASTSITMPAADVTLTATGTRTINTISPSAVAASPSTYYGAYVTNYTPTNNAQGPNGTLGWRIFYADSTNIYLIADDYVKNTYLSSAGFKTTGTQGIFTSTTRDDLITKLTTSSYYTNFKDSSATGYASYVTGTPTLQQFCASYNAKHPSAPIYYHYYSAANQTYGGYTSEAKGYALSWSSTTGYNWLLRDLPKDDSLYIKTSNLDAYGMWLATPSTFIEPPNEECLLLIGDYYGVISAGRFGCGNGIDIQYARPVVCLNSTVKLIGPDANGKYTLTK